MKTYNAALQAQLDAYLSEQSGLPQSKAAAMIGVSPTALSQYRNSKYPGDVEAVESKIEEFLRTRSAAAQAEAEKAPYLSAGYVPTSVSEDVYKAIQYCQLERGIVVLHGDAGIGKTRGAARFVQDNPANAIYIRCTPVGGTLTAMLRQLGTALKLPATRNRLELSMAIHDRLKGTDKVIIIDEAQNLRFDALEELRSLSDPDDLTGESGTGICLIGNSEVYSRMLGKQEAQFAQQFSRVRFRRRYSTADVKLADGVTGKSSVKELSYSEACKVIGELEARQGTPPPRPKKTNHRKRKPGGVSEGQERKVWALMYRLAAASPSTVAVGDRLRAAIKKEAGVDAFADDPFAWLDYKSCNKLIEALKGYVKNAERKAGAADG